MHVHVYISKLQYSEKLLREKIFTNFAVWEPPAKVFSTKFWANCTRWFSIPRKFLREMFVSYRSAEVFSLESFLLYGSSLPLLPRTTKDREHRQGVRCYRYIHSQQSQLPLNAPRTFPNFLCTQINILPWKENLGMFSLPSSLPGLRARCCLSCYLWWLPL